MAKKRFYFFIFCTPFLLASSCFYNIPNQKNVTNHQTNARKTYVDLDILVRQNLFKTKSDAFIETWKNHQQPDHEWIQKLKTVWQTYQTHLQKKDDNLVEFNRIKRSLSDLINQKWYWFLQNLNLFEWQFDGIEDSIFQNNVHQVRLSQSYQNQKKLFLTQNTYKQKKYKPLKIQMVHIPNDFLDSAQVFYLLIDDFYFLRLEYFFRGKSDQYGMARLDLNIYRFNSQKPPNFLLHSLSYHNVLVHAQNLRYLQIGFKQFETLTRNNGLLLKYLLTKAEWNQIVDHNMHEEAKS